MGADFFKKFGLWIGIGVGTIVVAIIAIVLISKAVKSSDVNAAVEFSKSFNQVSTEILPDPSKDGAPTVNKSAIENARKALAEFAQKNKDKEIGGLAKVAEGVAALQAGDAAGAADILKVSVETPNMDPAISAVAWQAYAAAADAAGRRDEAIKAYEEMTKGNGYVAKGFGFMYLGDLFNPLMKATPDQPADAAKAREYYDKGVEQLAGDEEVMSPERIFILKSIKARLAVLK
jgi:tetratricopeptide (TPR) repeat protein